MITKIKRIKFKNFQWIDVTFPNESLIHELGHEFHFHPLDLQECLKTSQRTKLESYDEYLFAVMIFPIFNRVTREIRGGQLKFFISKKYLITIGHREFRVFDDLVKLFEAHPQVRKRFSDTSPERLLYEILNKLFAYCFPMVDHMIIDCDNIERSIFESAEKTMISDILMVRRNINYYRKIMQVHKNVLKKLIHVLKGSKLYEMKKTDAYFENIIDSTKEIWDTLDNLKERIEAIQDTNEAQLSFRLQEAMKMLTILSVLTFPLTLIAGIFSMHSARHLSFIDNPSSFWVIIGCMGAITLGMIIAFKKNRWL